MRASLPVSFLATSAAEPSPRRFARFAATTATWTGTTSAFVVAMVVVLAWAAMGPMFNYSDTWQLVINTGTTIVTFLMVFLIQNTQNRDTKALQIKLSELILALETANDRMATIEHASQEELEAAQQEIQQRVEEPAVRDSGGPRKRKVRSSALASRSAKRAALKESE
jgi:low affinity Fe/Cu permease